MSANEHLDTLCAAAADYLAATEKLREGNDALAGRMERLLLAKEFVVEAEAAVLEAKRGLLRAVVDRRILE